MKTKSNDNRDFDVFLRRLLLASACKKDAIINEAQRILDGRSQPDQLLLTGAAACRVLSISPATLWRLRAEGKIKPVKLRNGHPRYRRSDLLRMAEGAQ